MIRYETDDPTTLAGRTAFGEARGEPWEGKVAVCHVLLTRQLDGRHGPTIRDVALRRAQFSCFLPGPHRAAVDAFPLGRGEERAAGECLRAAVAVLAGRLPDPTHGATHYLARKLYDSPKCPKWAKEPPVKVSAEIGQHVFLVWVRW